MRKNMLVGLIGLAIFAASFLFVKEVFFAAPDSVANFLGGSFGGMSSMFWITGLNRNSKVVNHEKLQDKNAAGAFDGILRNIEVGEFAKQLAANQA